MYISKLVIAFDIDDTLIIPSVVTRARDVPNYETIAVYRWFQAQGFHMVLWSGAGVDWARTWGDKLGLQPDEIRVKGEGHVDIAFDDMDVKLATVNVKVGRVANNISCEIWNKTKRPA